MEPNREQYIDILAKGFYGMAVRNGPLEDFHAEGRPIGDKEMEILNRHAHNVISYLLKLLIEGEIDKLYSLCAAESLFLSYFDPADYNSEEVRRLERTYDLLRGNGVG